MKFSYFASSLVVALLILPCSSFTCIHDKITVKQSPVHLIRSIKYRDVVDERKRNPNLFESLRIHFYIDTFDSNVPINAIHNVEIALQKIRDYIITLFQGLFSLLF